MGMPTASVIEYRESPLLLPQDDEQAALHMTPEQISQLLYVIEHVNRGVQLEQVMDELYQHVSRVIPCNRLGLALLDERGQMIIARWARSDRSISLGEGYQAPLASSSLAAIVQSGRVRIINDLQQYVHEHPESHSTQLLLQEGMRSSLTCPLIIRGQTTGFLFFTSTRPGAYSDASVWFYQHIAAQVSVLVEKGRLYSELAEYTRRIERQNQNMHRQMELAKQLQRTFIPERAPEVPGIDVAFLYEPADEVGGDLVEFMPVPGGKLLVFIADAMGHGVSAALAMAAVRALLLTVCRETTDPSEILRRLNTSLPALLAQQFAAAISMLIEPEAGTLTFARAGLPPPVLVEGSTGTCRPLSEGGLPLSLESSEPYCSTQTPFANEDMLILATDGLTEAVNAAGEEYGATRLCDIASSCRSTPARDCLQAIAHDLNRFRGGALAGDDMSIVIIRRTPLP
jgi:serine phosphatase RsbU (regulator of sigma subunit)